MCYEEAAWFLVKAEKEKMRYGLQEYYYLKLDIKSFFTSIDKQTLYELFLRRIKNKEVLWLLKVIIFHDPVRDIKPILQSSPALFDLLPQEKSLFKVKKGKGLPIGNLTSQFFANVYLNELDQYVKHTLKVKYYLRYVDDFILLDPSRERLEEMKVLIERFLLDKLQLKLHPKKQIIREVGTGIDFVGFIIRADYVLIRKRVLNDFKRAIEKAELMPAGTIQSKKIRQQLNSYFAHTMWGNCYTFSRRLLGESNWLASCHGEKIGIMSEEEMRRWSLILFEGAKDDYIMKEKPLLEGVVVKSSSSITFFLTNQEKCLNI